MEINKIHDSLVRDILSKKDEAIIFFREMLPKEFIENLDLYNLEVEDGTFIDNKLQQYFSDILFKVPVRGMGYQNIYLLFEHKSYPDKRIHFQLLKYIAEIYSKQTVLMPVIPIVFYHGKSKWKTSARFSDIFSEEVKKSGFTEFLDFKYYLVDLNNIDLEKLHFSLTLSFYLGILKISEKPDYEIRFLELLKRTRQLFLSKDNSEFLHKMFLYIFHTTEMSKEKLGEMIENTISKEAREIAMTTAEKLIQEGEIKGELKGKLEGQLETAKKMLAKGTDIEFILEVTGLSKEELKKAGILI